MSRRCSLSHWLAASALGSLGAATTEELVVQGMKLTPCHPTMLQARDGILAADEILNGGVNRCKLWRAFASRPMGTGASSPDENSTSAIVTSDAVPVECSIAGAAR
jgi:extracellular elastinolytic metalloproteinase